LAATEQLIKFPLEEKLRTGYGWGMFAPIQFKVFCVPLKQSSLFSSLSLWYGCEIITLREETMQTTENS